MKRVVITGMGAVSPLGENVAAMVSGMELGKTAVRFMEGWDHYKGLHCLIGAPAELKNEMAIPRKNRRSMGRLSFFAVQAAEQAIREAGLDSAELTSGRTGCILGSTMGGVEAMNDTFELLLPNKDLAQLSSMRFFQCMSHTAAMNVAQFFGITGYVLATSAACASALQALGTGFELIRSGRQDVLLCGGAEELHPIVTATFDILFATSTHYNAEPQLSPRPFDEKRDGLVCGEGAGVLVLEESEHALRRGAKIYAEVIGYSTCGSGEHVSESNRQGIFNCMERALADAGISAKEVSYINAHATATLQGDQAEAEAIKEVFGDGVPVSSLKGNMGHTLGASGALELIASIVMMQKDRIYPTLNLKSVAKECEGIWHVMEPLKKKIDIVFKNCFAFGGINASLVCKKWS
jgi:3-oxoacyl-[acyl-carrier-protein] synthase II